MGETDQPNRCELSLAAGGLGGSGFSVDAKAGVIHGATIAKLGSMSPDSGGRWRIDPTSLAEICDAINTAKNGVPVKCGHVSLMEGRGGPSESVVGHLYLVGRCRNARIEGERLVGDIELAGYADDSPKAPGLRRYLIGVAAEDPEKISLSPNMIARLRPGAGGEQPVRVGVLRSVDFVEVGASTGRGLAAAAGDGETTAFTDPEQTQDGAVPSEALTEEILMEKNDAKALQAAQKEGHTAGAAAERERVSEILALAARYDVDQEFVDPMIRDGTDRKRARELVMAEADRRKAVADQEAAIEKARNDAAKAERDRRTAILEMAKTEGLNREWADEHIEQGTPAEDAGKDAAKQIAEKSEHVQMGAGRIRVGAAGGDQLIEDASDAILLGAGVDGFFKRTADGEQVLMAGSEDRPGKLEPVRRTPSEAAHNQRGLSIVDIAKWALVQMGAGDVYRIPARSMVDLMVGRKRFDEVVPGTHLQLAGTGDLTSVLKNAINKAVTGVSLGRQTRYERFCRRKTITNMQLIESMRLSEAPGLERLAEGGEVIMKNFTDSGESYRAYRYAIGTTLTFEAIVNDDKDAFRRVPAYLVDRAFRKRDRLAFALLVDNDELSDGSALFVAGHSNLVSASGSVGVPSVSTLNVMAKTLFEAAGTQEDDAGTTEPLELELVGIIVPSGLYGTAWQLVNSTGDPAGSHTGVANRWNNGRIDVVQSAQLQDNSSAYWYAFADPELGEGLEYAVLSGYENPQVFNRTQWATGNTEIAVVDVFGVGAIGYRGIARNNGS